MWSDNRGIKVNDKQQWIQDTVNDLMYFEGLSQTQAIQQATELWNNLQQEEFDLDENAWKWR